MGALIRRNSQCWGTAASALLALLCLATLLAAAAPAEAAVASPTVQITPSSIALAAGDVVEVDVLVNNTSTTAMTVVAVDPVSGPWITATMSSTDLPAALPAGSSIRVRLRVSAGEVVNASEIGVVADIRPADAAASGDLGPMLVSGTLKVTPATEPVAPEATFVVFPTKLNDGESRRAAVRLVNGGAATYTDVVVRAIDADDVRLEPAAGVAPSWSLCPAAANDTGRVLACLDKLGPGASVLLDVDVRADPSVRTGTQQVGVVVNATRELASGASTSLPVAAVVSRDVTLAVFGVDVISPFGIGTLFVLPGLLAVVVFLGLAAAVYPRTNALPDTIALTDLRAMPIVVALSALAYGAYWVLRGENLTREVSTSSVAWLFGFGVIVGALAWGVMARAYRRFIGRKRFTVDDDCATLLDRLQARGARLTLPEFRSNGLRYLHLGPAQNGGAFGAPPIAYSFTKEGQSENATSQRQAFYRALEHDGDIPSVLAAHRAGTVKLIWTNPTGVRTFEATEVDVQGEGSLLEPGRGVAGP